MIKLLKKGGRHVWEGLDDYRPITLLNTELKILAWVLVNRLQLVISDLIDPEQTFAVKGRSIQDNLHLIHKVLQGIEDDTEAALISLLQEPRSIFTKAKISGSVLGGVAIPFQGPSAGVMDPSTSSRCGLGLTSNWSEIGRKYKLR